MPPRLMRDRQNVFQENELNMKIERRNPTTLNMKAHSGEIDWCLRRVSQLKWNEIVSETRLFNMREGKHKTTNTFNGIGSHRAEAEWKWRRGISHIPSCAHVLAVQCVFLLLIISFLCGWWAWFVLENNSCSVARCTLMATTAKRRGTDFMWFYVYTRGNFAAHAMTLCNGQRANVMFLENALAASTTASAHITCLLWDANNTRQPMQSHACSSLVPRQCVPSPWQGLCQFLDLISVARNREMHAARMDPRNGNGVHKQRQNWIMQVVERCMGCRIIIYHNIIFPC